MSSKSTYSPKDSELVINLKKTLPRWSAFLKAKLRDYAILVKYRLNLTVVFSAVVGYLLAVGGSFDWLQMMFLGVAGFVVTGSANAINQILEKDYDKLMVRTANRPLAAGRMSTAEAVLIAGLLGVGGIGLLWYCFNELAALIGSLSLLSYAFIYTPLKRISPIAVFVGAIPGALPPIIGWAAATSALGYEALVLFSMQFLWQFPHFWAIGWLGAEQYEKAGYKLVPTSDQRNRYTAFQTIVYIVVLTIVTLIPTFLGMVTMVSLVASLVCGAFFLYYGVNLFRKCDNDAALKLMFASIIYLPVLQTIMVLDRVFLV